jgi:glycosyltransferase involved in cell wall biosynthesis
MSVQAARARMAFVSLWDAADTNAHSGAAYAMRRELSRHFDLVDCFPMDAPAESLALMPLQAFYKALGRPYEPMRERIFLKAVARRVADAVKRAAADLVFSPSSLPVAYLETELPVFWATDLLFATYLRTYLANPAPRMVREGHAHETAALARARRVSFPSAWAAREATRHYGTPAQKIDVIPWGANLSHPVPGERVAAAIEARSREICQLVFIGKDWERKGGDLVLATAKLLNQRGLRTTLAIVGCTPPVDASDRIKVYPFLDKSVPSEWDTFSRLMFGSHFFFMPSRAEASPHALCEAAAFGLVSLSSTAGGIPTIVKDGSTGYTRSRDCEPAVFADLIEATFRDRSRYQAMSLAARQDYQDRLNWPQFAERWSRQIYAAL